MRISIVLALLLLCCVSSRDKVKPYGDDGKTSDGRESFIGAGLKMPVEEEKK